MNIEPPSRGLAGRRALVTGAARGIGFGIARRLLQEGAQVLLVDVLDGALAEALAGLPEPLAARAAVCRADVSADAEVEAAVAAAVARFGGLEILVNNAGISPKHEGRKMPVAGMDPAEWRRVVEVNLTGAFLCCRAALPHMQKAGWGRIVNIASQAGRTRADIAGAHYAASKAGMIGLARTLAGEVGKSGITVNSIAPGRIVTPMAAEAGASFNEAYLASIPVGRLGTVEDIAGAVAYLASEEAGFITGMALDVNGGFFML